MSQGGKFSNPRPYRDEERQIEETFRQLTEEKPSPRRQKQLPKEEPPLFSQTMQEIQEEPLFSQTLQEIVGQEPPVVPPMLPAEDQPKTPAAPTAPKAAAPEVSQETVMLPKMPPQQPQQPQRPPVSHPQPPAPARKPKRFDLLPQDVDAFFDGDGPDLEEEPAQQEGDFVDTLGMYLGKAIAFCRKNRMMVLIAACGIALALIVGFGAAFLTSAVDSNDGKILDNVLIADINVGGMTKNEAISAVTQAASHTYPVQDMVIDLSGVELRLSPKDTKAALDVTAAVDAAYNYGRTGTQSERDQALADSRTQEHIIGLLPYLELDTDYIQQTLTAYAEDTGSTLTQTAYGLEGAEPELSTDNFNESAPTQTLVITMGSPGIGFDVKEVYDQVLDAYSLHRFLVSVENVESTQDPDPIDLEAIYKEFYIKPVDETINLQTFEVIPGSYGYEFDLKEAQKLVENAEFGQEIRIPMTYIEPKLLDADSFLSDTLGEYQTRQTSNADRNRNLELACNAINGYVMDPGDTLSFSDVLGQRTEARGYKSAPEDSGAEETMGGGINQVASTLYYAALLADLDIVSRTNNDFVPSYIDMGLDATANLKIRNNTGFPVSIEARLSGGFVTIRILGTEERDHYVMLEYSISSTKEPQIEYQEFLFDNLEGYVDGDIIMEGVTGYQVKSYKVKYNNQNGRELSRDFITNSQYPTVNQIVAVVEEPVVTEPPTQPPTEPPAPTETTPPPTQAPVPPATEPPVTEPPAAPETTAPPETAPAVMTPETTPVTEMPPVQPESVSESSSSTDTIATE